MASKAFRRRVWRASCYARWLSQSSSSATSASGKFSTIRVDLRPEISCHARGPP